ncbi:MAG: alpha-L-fucosidase [Bacteroidales bacterium]|nr:MAG: alpha-L-fucosidase [Bacteroidales bacterium]
MKRLLILAMNIILVIPCAFNQDQNPRLQWWQEARFGMFIHFGIYSIPGRGEWVRSVERISNEEYQPYVDEFNPYDYNPEEWATLAKSAGMKYAVMTAKHHDGFCLFNSELTDYKSNNSPIGRDLIKEYVNAFRDRGLKVGFYYSIIDWHHYDYPKYDDPFHPMRGNKKFKDEKINWERYLEYMHGQVRELMTNYGKIDILWLDFSYGNMKGEKWKARELVDMIRKLQPEIILNNRLSGSGGDHSYSEALGDFITPEQSIPDNPLLDTGGDPVPWETCLTLNNNWGYNKTDQNWKSPELIVHTLVNCVSKGGNLLLNVGPDARGNIPDESKEILQQVGKWMAKNSESIYGCGMAAALEKPDWGRITQKGNKLYLHVMYPLIGPVKLHGYRDRIERVRFVSTGSEAPATDEWWGSPESEGYIFINMDKPIHETFQWHDPWDTVIEITLNE